MRLPQLDDRLSRASALFPACAYGADIGADHGRLSCYLLKTGKCQRMCVADISQESLKKAERLLSLHGVYDRADIKVGDGLRVLEKPADAIAILGMGSRTLSKILLEGKERLRGGTLIVSGHTDIPLLRHTVSAIGYRIDAEEIAWAGGRFYVIIRAVPGGEQLTEKQLCLGPRLMEQKNDRYAAYLAWRAGNAAAKRTEEGKRELQWIREEEERVRHGEND